MEKLKMFDMINKHLWRDGKENKESLILQIILHSLLKNNKFISNCIC